MEQKISIDRTELAPPGIPSRLILSTESTQSFVEIEPSPFQVQCELSRINKLTSDSSIDLDSFEGDSFFCLPQGVSTLKIFSNGIELNILTNTNRELALVQASLSAVSNNEAESLFTAALCPVLDHWSFLANTPVSIKK